MELGAQNMAWNFYKMEPRAVICLYLGLITDNVTGNV